MTEPTFIVEPGKQEVVMECTFNAPAAKVFDAFTNPEKIVKWWGGKTYQTKVDVYDSRAGGSWRLIQSGQDNDEFAFHGVFHDVTPSERIIWTFEFEGMPEKGHALMETNYFTETDGKTHVKTVSVFQSVADRDGMVASGMETGATDAYRTLAELVEV